jgi:hypothetical protein
VIYRLTEKYDGERYVWVEAASKRDALTKARDGDVLDAGEPDHSNYRYRGPVEETSLVQTDVFDLIEELGTT